MSSQGSNSDDSYVMVPESAETSTNSLASDGTPNNHPNRSISTQTPLASEPSVLTLIERNNALEAQIKWLWNMERGRQNRYEYYCDILRRNNQGLEDENEELQYQCGGLQNENDALWDKNGKLEDEIMRKCNTIRLRDAEIETLKQEKQMIAWNAQTESDMLRRQNEKLQKQLNEYRRNQINGSIIAGGNITRIIELEKAQVNNCGVIKELENELILEKWDKRETQKIAISSQERLEEQQASHLEEMAKMQETIDNHEIGRMNARDKLEEQDELIRFLQHGNTKLAKMLEQHSEDAAEKDLAFLRVLKDHEKHARKLQEDKERLEQRLQGVAQIL
ncbi:hypothetical protein V8E51_001713 [Hyaloscypha variabilis]